jgi:hypothetical protein
MALTACSSGHHPAVDGLGSDAGAQTANVPPPSPFPTRESTGPRKTEFVKPPGEGIFRVDRDGTVYDGYDLRGRNVYITASNVTFRNTLFSATATIVTGIVDSRGKGLLVEDSEIDGGPVFGRGVYALGTDQVFRRVRFVHTGAAAVEGTSFTVEKSWIGDVGSANDDHIDGVQVTGGKDVTIRQNTIVLDTNQTSTLGIWAELADTDNVVIEDNLLAGGGATIYFEEKGGFRLTDVVFRNNALSTALHKNVGYWGPVYPNVAPGVVWEGNYILETHESLSLQQALQKWDTGH